MSSTSKGDNQPRGETVRVLQLTDTHLYADPEGRLLGQNTRQTLELVLEMATGTADGFDLVLLTGDLVHDESTEGYDYLQRRLALLDTPCYCLPGNHDEARVMSHVFDDCAVRIATADRCAAWNLVLLDSTIPGDDGGHLPPGQLARLQKALSARPDDPALVCLHHQPVPVGSAWIDTMALDNPDDFFGILDRHPRVRGVLWGHVHQEFSSVRNGVQLMGTPSTCIQFLPDSKEFAMDRLTPGYRLLELRPDGRIETRVERVADYPDPLKLGAGGY